jgi:hypothetical protein
MIELEYEMTYAETIEGPLGPTNGSPLGERLCWQVTTATLRGPRIDATLAMPGTDWIRLGPAGTPWRDAAPGVAGSLGIDLVAYRLGADGDLLDLEDGWPVKMGRPFLSLPPAATR